jgi:hypothetical protein
VPPLIEPIQIEGLRGIIRALRLIDADLPKQLRLAANEAANIVVDEAKRDVPRRSGKAQASIKAKSTRAAARVTSGGRRAPYMPWLDYGGKVGRNNSASRPFIADGRYVYPAFRRKRDEFEKVMRQRLADIVRDAGLELG